jgi:hypothetical protein
MRTITNKCECIVDLDQARPRALQFLSRIRHQSRHRRRSSIREYLTSGPAKWWAAYRVFGANAETQAVLELVRRVNAFAICPEPVEYWRVPKRNGGFRELCALPLPLKATNYMVKDVLEATLQPGAHLYAVRGKGRDREAREIKRVLDSGYEFAFVGDIRSCFACVQPNALYDLPLPQTVIRCTLDYRSMTFRHNQRKEDDDTPCRAHECALHNASLPQRNGPHGLLPGSPSSNLVLAWLLNDLPASLPAQCTLFVNTDNILVAARDAQVCRTAGRTLRIVLRRHRAGPFRLEGNVVAVEGGFERLGYEFRKVMGSVEIEPSSDNLDRIHTAIEVAKHRDHLGRGELIEVRRVLRQRLNGFSAITMGRTAWAQGLLEATARLLARTHLATTHKGCRVVREGIRVSSRRPANKDCTSDIHDSRSEHQR